MIDRYNFDFGRARRMEVAKEAPDYPLVDMYS